MRQLVLSLVFALATLTLAAPARADVTYQFTTALAYPVTFEGKALPPLALHAVVGLVPLTPSWNLIMKGGMATPLALFQPAPQLQLGLSTKLSEVLRLGATGIYRYAPAWVSAPTASHIAGASIAPGIAITKELTLSLPLALTRNITTDTWVGAGGLELAFRLPI